MLLAEIVRLAGDEELSPGVRLRIALDVLEQLPAERALDPRGPKGLSFDAVEVGDDGTSQMTQHGDGSGALALVWEILAGRKAEGAELPPLREVVDDIPADVSEVMERGAEAASTAGELAEKLEEASKGYLDTHDDVRVAVAHATRPKPSAAPSAPPPTAAPAIASPSATPSSAASAPKTAGAPAAPQAAAAKAASSASAGAGTQAAEVAAPTPASTPFRDLFHDSDWPSFDDLEVPSFALLGRDDPAPKVEPERAEGAQPPALAAIPPPADAKPAERSPDKPAPPGRPVPPDAPPAPPLPARLRTPAMPEPARPIAPPSEPTQATATPAAQAKPAEARRRPEAPETRVERETTSVATTPIPPRPLEGGTEAAATTESKPTAKPAADSPLVDEPKVIIHDLPRQQDEGEVDGEGARPKARRRSSRDSDARSSGPDAEAREASARKRAGEDMTLPPLPVKSNFRIVVTIVIAALATLAAVAALMTRAG